MARDWRLWLDSTARPGWANMSIDMALLDRAEQEQESWLRLYRWDPGCLSFGRHEPATRRYDSARIRALRIDTVRRPSGGRAVWHQRELTYAVAAPCARFDSLQSAYRDIHLMLVQALQGLGITAVLAPHTRVAPLGAGACFSQPVGGEVLVHGRKVVGSAQVRRGSAFLQHGSILLGDQQDLIRELMSDHLDADPHSKARPDPLAGLPLEVLSSAILDSARARWSGLDRQITEPAPVLQLATRHYGLFRSDAWTWAR
jgi:lipoate-protein ligase A